MSAPCGRAGRCSAKYRHQVRPARDRIWRRVGGRGRRPLSPPDTPPASLAAVAAVGGWVPGPEPAEGRSRCDFSAEGVGAALGTKGGVRAPELPLVVSAASGARAFGCALRPLPATLGAGRRCSPSCRCHQPAEADLGQGRGHIGPAPSSGGKVECCSLCAASPRAFEKRQK